jgi:membrane-bound metal-dependent hydrolase YbcI (DUF457 family)
MSLRGSKTPIFVVAIAAVLLFLADRGAEQAGGSTFPGGPLDEIAHALTAALALWALGWRLPKAFWIGALAASVLIDADHIPDRLGAHRLTAGTPRPYTHSLLTLVCVVAIAAIWRRGRPAMLGVLFGLVLHFWRDLSEPGTGVALLWPFSDHSFNTSHASYLIIMAAVVTVAVLRTPEVGHLYRRLARRRLPSSELT